MDETNLTQLHLMDMINLIEFRLRSIQDSSTKSLLHKTNLPQFRLMDKFNIIEFRLRSV